MALNSFGLNSAALNTSGDEGDADVLSLSIFQEVYTTGTVFSSFAQEVYNAVAPDDTSVLAWSYEQSVFSEGAASLLFSQEVVDFDEGAVSVSFQQEIFSHGSASVFFAQSTSRAGGVAELPGGTASATKSGVSWTASVSLGNTDVSALLVGSITVDKEEGSSVIAEFTLKPGQGDVDVYSWAKAPVSITYKGRDSAGGLEITHTLFKGEVVSPVYNPTTLLTSFTCSDNLQRTVDGMSNEAIKTLLSGSSFSQMVMEELSGYALATSLLETVPYSLDKDINGELKYYPWLSSGNDYTFSDSDVLDSSLTVNLSSSGDVVNEVVIKIDKGRTSFREVKAYFEWSSPAAGLFTPVGPSIITEKAAWQEINNGSTPVSYSGFIQAVEGTGFVLSEAPVATRNSFVIASNDPKWGYAPHNGGIITAKVPATLRYTQDIAEQVEFVVRSEKSVAQLGTLGLAQDFSFNVEYQEDFSSSFLETEEVTGTRESVTGPWTKSSITHNWKKYKNYLETNNVGGSGETELNAAAYITQGDSSAYSEVVDYHINKAKTAIKHSHRQVTVSIGCVINPFINRGDRVTVNTSAVVASGTVGQVSHVLDTSTGSATSEVTLKISKANAILSSDAEEDKTAAETSAGAIAPFWTYPENFVSLGYEVEFSFDGLPTNKTDSVELFPSSTGNTKTVSTEIPEDTLIMRA